MKVLSKKTKIAFIFSLLIVLMVTILISLRLGSIDISFTELIKGMLSGESTGNVGIIKDLRMPRVIIAVLIGANLAISGVLLQAVIRNPLADPYITGGINVKTADVSLSMVYDFMGKMPKCVGLAGFEFERAYKTVPSGEYARF